MRNLAALGPTCAHLCCIAYPVTFLLPSQHSPCPPALPTAALSPEIPSWALPQAARLQNWSNKAGGCCDPCLERVSSSRDAGRGMVATTLALLGGSASALFLLTASARLSPRSSAAACASRNLVATPLPEPSLRALSPCDSPVRGRAWTTRQPTCTTAPWPDECGACNVQLQCGCGGVTNRTLCLPASVGSPFALRYQIYTVELSRASGDSYVSRSEMYVFILRAVCGVCGDRCTDLRRRACESVKPARRRVVWLLDLAFSRYAYHPPGGLTKSLFSRDMSLRQSEKPGGANGGKAMSSRRASPSKQSSSASWIETSEPIVTASRNETRYADHVSSTLPAPTALATYGPKRTGKRVAPGRGSGGWWRVEGGGWWCDHAACQWWWWRRRRRAVAPPTVKPRSR